MKKWRLSILFCLLMCFCATSAQARVQNLGIHILHPAEITEAVELVKTEDNAPQWVYVTLTLSLDDLEKKDEWQNAFKVMKDHNIIPIVRLVSRFDSERGVWAIPTRADIMSLFAFLRELQWPSEHRYIIAFNEPNHFNEWGGERDPYSYARVLDFVADWAHTENLNYQILPAAMDLAANSGNETMEAFAYFEAMWLEYPQVFDKIDYWNSHSYPNPAFSSDPSRTEKNSLRGFQHELNWLKEKNGREMHTFITETGWEDNSRTRGRLLNYYDRAFEQVWNDERVIAITPFVLRGDPGPFAGFSFLDRDGNPTRQYSAYHAQIEKNARSYREWLESFEVSDF